VHKSSANDRVFVPLLVVLRHLNSIEVDDSASARVSSGVPATAGQRPLLISRKCPAGHSLCARRKISWCRRHKIFADCALALDQRALGRDSRRFLILRSQPILAVFIFAAVELKGRPAPASRRAGDACAWGVRPNSELRRNGLDMPIGNLAHRRRSSVNLA
jgi:hypothetical protein